MLSERQIKDAKATKQHLLSNCLKVYQGFYECSQNGTCNGADREKLKQAYQNCGDLILKKDKIPAKMRKLAEVVREEQRPGEAWNRAMKRMAERVRGLVKVFNRKISWYSTL